MHLPSLVPLETTGEDFLSGKDALVALAALGNFWGLEGHDFTLILEGSKKV